MGLLLLQRSRTMLLSRTFFWCSLPCSRQSARMLLIYVISSCVIKINLHQQLRFLIKCGIKTGKDRILVCLSPPVKHLEGELEKKEWCDQFPQRKQILGSLSYWTNPTTPVLGVFKYKQMPYQIINGIISPNRKNLFPSLSSLIWYFEQWVAWKQFCSPRPLYDNFLGDGQCESCMNKAWKEFQNHIIEILQPDPRVWWWTVNCQNTMYLVQKLSSVGIHLERKDDIPGPETWQCWGLNNPKLRRRQIDKPEHSATSPKQNVLHSIVSRIYFFS